MLVPRAVQAAGPRLSTEQLLDRYESHTKHCRVCSNALTNTQRAITACSIAYKLAVFAAAVAAAAALCGGQVNLRQCFGIVLHFPVLPEILHVA